MFTNILSFVFFLQLAFLAKHLPRLLQNLQRRVFNVSKVNILFKVVQYLVLGVLEVLIALKLVHRQKQRAINVALANIHHIPVHLYVCFVKLDFTTKR